MAESGPRLDFVFQHISVISAKRHAQLGGEWDKILIPNGVRFNIYHFMIDPKFDTATIKAVRVIRYISIGLFLFSLTQNSFSTGDGDTGSPGLINLLLGTLFFYTSPASWVWFANPLLLFAWIYLFSKPKVSLITSLLASLVSLSFIGFDSIRTDEGGFLHPIVKYGIGYRLWVASSLTMLFPNVYRKWLVNVLPDEG